MIADDVVDDDDDDDDVVDVDIVLLKMIMTTMAIMNYDD